MRNEIIHYLKTLRDRIIHEFETVENSSHHFERIAWDHKSGGGGEISSLRGIHFEKAAVNWSGVSGPNFPLAHEASGPFFATGVSLITHMQNPHAPTVHFNIRYIETEKGSWLGGGYDLSPMGFPYEEDTLHFHQVAREALAPFGKTLYAEFSQNAREYFFIPHYQEERGVGGIFFDHYRTEDEEHDLLMWKSIGDTFLQAIIPIYERRIHIPFSAEEKEKQLKMRARYAEFNFLYDRGTQFGFRSGGNPQAILCSMPPLAKW